MSGRPGQNPVRCRNSACAMVLGVVRSGTLRPSPHVATRVLEIDHAAGVRSRYHRNRGVDLVCPSCGWTLAFRWPDSEAA